MTPNRRHFLNARGDTPGCQALLELGIREHGRKTPTKNLVVEKEGCEIVQFLKVAMFLDNSAIIFIYSREKHIFLHNIKNSRQSGATFTVRNYIAYSMPHYKKRWYKILSNMYLVAHHRRSRRLNFLRFSSVNWHYCHQRRENEDHFTDFSRRYRGLRGMSAGIKPDRAPRAECSRNPFS